MTHKLFLLISLALLAVAVACGGPEPTATPTAVPTHTPTATPTPTPAPDEPVTFPDKNLEAAIRDALGKAPGEEITAAELAQLTILAPPLQ